MPLTALLIVFLCAVSASVSIQLKIKPPASQFTKPLGSSIVFTCELTDLESGSSSNNGPVMVGWTSKDGKEILDNAGRIYVEADSDTIKKLYITAIQNSDAGEYTCSSSMAGIKKNKSVTLHLFKDIAFDVAPMIQNPKLHTDALVQCVVSGQPKPDVSWRYKGQRINTGGRYIMEVDRGLKILNISKNDDRVYTCRAEVDAEGRYDERKITVLVHVPPVIVSGPGLVQGVQGRNAVVNCKADGLPEPTYAFYKNSIIQMTTSDRVSVDSIAGALHFHTLEKGDEGDYECRAINDVGQTSVVGQLKVFVPPLIYEMNNVTALEGSTAVVECLSHGDPVPDMSLFRGGDANNIDLGESEKGRISLSQEPGRLVFRIQNLSLSDSNSYTCTSTNNVGFHEQQSMLTVNYAPRFSSTHNQLVYGWADTQVKQHNISCNVRALPSPSIEWLNSKGSVLKNNKVFHIFLTDVGSDLQVSINPNKDQKDIYGSYTCRARNQFGQAELKIQFVQATVPDPPVVDVIDRTPNEIILLASSRTSTGAMRVVGFRASHQSNFFNSDNVDVSSFNISGSITVDSLVANTKYILFVTAENQVGVSNHTTVEVTTDVEQPPSMVHIISAPPESERYVVSWKKPTKNGGLPITEYRIKYRKVDVLEDGSYRRMTTDWNEIGIQANMPSFSKQEYTIDGLEPDSYYQLEILAANREGLSPPSSDFYFKTAEGSVNLLPAVLKTSNTSLVVIVVVTVLVGFLIIVDVSCYALNNCGLTMCICVQLCGRSRPISKQKDMEEGDSKEILKEVPAEVDEAKNAESEETIPEIALPALEEQDQQVPLIADFPPPPPIEEREIIEEIKPVNRKSILSYGDGRWKDVVQELETQLGVKKQVHSDDEEDDNNKIKEDDDNDDNDSRCSSPKWRFT